MSEKLSLTRMVTDFTEFELFCANTEEEELESLDEGFEKIILISTCRYGIIGTQVPKSYQMLSLILPGLDDRRLAFRRNLRMSRTQFSKLVDLIRNYVPLKATGRPQLPLEVQLAITVYRLGVFGNGASILKVAQEFGISDGGTVTDMTKRILNAILKLQQRFVSWPSINERKQISETLGAQKIPHCIGFIDGTHIQLAEKPEDDPEDYINRKNQPTIQLQLVVDQNKSIRHFFVGFPGSVHDARVFAHCDLFTNMDKYFSGTDYIIGDAAYTLSTRLLTPYRKQGGNLPADQKKFNWHISSKRVRVEHANGMLKRRFASLNGLRMRVNKKGGHKFACDWISACCILYNYLLSDPWTQDDIDFDLLDENRQTPLPDEDDNQEIPEDADISAVDKRNALKEYILGI